MPFKQADFFLLIFRLVHFDFHQLFWVHLMKLQRYCRFSYLQVFIMSLGAGCRCAVVWPVVFVGVASVILDLLFCFQRLWFLLFLNYFVRSQLVVLLSVTLHVCHLQEHASKKKKKKENKRKIEQNHYFRPEIIIFRVKIAIFNQQHFFIIFMMKTHYFYYSTHISIIIKKLISFQKHFSFWKYHQIFQIIHNSTQLQLYLPARIWNTITQCSTVYYEKKCSYSVTSII